MSEDSLLLYCVISIFLFVKTRKLKKGFVINNYVFYGAGDDFVPVT
jgi:hypothetical protein